jgi:hypothetical protein
MPVEQLHEPWRSFFRDIDAQLAGPTEIHCLGGFVIAEYYGLARRVARRLRREGTTS